MSRRHQHYRDALEEALADVARLDFMEVQEGSISKVEEGFYFSSLGKNGNAHAGYAPTVRGAIDRAIAEHQERERERKRWERFTAQLKHA